MGTQTKIRQTQFMQPSKVYTDSLGAGSALQSSSTDVETDFNAVRSQLNRIIDAAMSGGKWYDDIAIYGTKRGLKQLGFDLNDLENKKLLFRAQVLTDITVPAAAFATGALVGVPGANLNDGETFTLSDGIHTPTVFEFDSGGGVVGSNIAVPFTSGDSANTVAGAMRTAINGVTTTLEVSAGGTNQNVTLTNDTRGSHGNIPITYTVADATFVAGVSGMSSGAGDEVLLVQSSGETPTEVAAVGTSITPGTANGTVVVDLATGVIGRWASSYVIGQNAINPRNLVVVRDAGNDDPILSAGKEVYGLLQAQFGVADGDPFDDSTKKVQISFVREAVGGGHTLEHVPAEDIGGKVINYMYVLRTNLDAVPDYVFLTGVFVDQSASVDVTLNNAIDNQSGPATQSQNIDWRIDDTKTLKFQDSTGGSNLLAILPNAGNDIVQLNVDTFDVNTTGNADFNNGVVADSAGVPINLGVTGGQIDSASNLTIAATGAGNDLHLSAADILDLTDGYRAASTFSHAMHLSDTSAEWSAYETKFGGEVSLLNAIVQAATKAGHTKNQAVVTAPIPINTDTAQGVNLDVALCNYAGFDFVTDVNVFVNGTLMRNGANVGAGEDCYPGTTPASGHVRFAFPLQASPGNPDVITMEVFGQE